MSTISFIAPLSRFKCTFPSLKLWLCLCYTLFRLPKHLVRYICFPASRFHFIRVRHVRDRNRRPGIPLAPNPLHNGLVVFDREWKRRTGDRRRVARCAKESQVWYFNFVTSKNDGKLHISSPNSSNHKIAILENPSTRWPAKSLWICTNVDTMTTTSFGCTMTG